MSRIVREMDVGAVDGGKCLIRGSINTSWTYLGGKIQTEWRAANKTSATSTVLFKLKQFILYRALVKLTTETHTAILAGLHRAYMGIRGFLAHHSWLSRAGP